MSDCNHSPTVRVWQATNGDCPLCLAARLAKHEEALDIAVAGLKVVERRRDELKARLAEAQNELESERKQRHFAAGQTEKVIRVFKMRLAEAEQRLVERLVAYCVCKQSKSPVDGCNCVCCTTTRFETQLAEAERLLTAWRHWYWNANSTGIDVPTLDATDAFLGTASQPDAAPTVYQPCGCSSSTDGFGNRVEFRCYAHITADSADEVQK